MMKRLSGLSVLILLGMAGVAEAKYVFRPIIRLRAVRKKLPNIR
ncbi:MAG: hypothetical protein V8R23_04320 [Alphaproteobacteria bacterium]